MLIGIVISPSANLKRLGGLFGFSFVSYFYLQALRVAVFADGAVAEG